MTTSTLPTSFMGYKANNDRNLTSCRELVQEHGLGYGVEKAQAIYTFQDGFEQAGNEFHLINSSTGKCLSTSTVGKDYKILTPNDLADDFQWFVDAGYATPFSAFRTANGRECLALMLNPDLFEDNGHTGFILGTNRQGLESAIGQLFLWRKICSNGMMGWAKQSRFTVRHMGEARQNLTDHTRDWARMEQTFQAMNERMSELSNIPMTLEALMGATDSLHGTFELGGTVQDVKTGKKASGQKIKARERTIAALNMPHMGTFGSTAADFYNAVTYNNSHLPAGSKRSTASLADSLLTGTGRNVEATALSILAGFEKTGTFATV